MKILIIGSGGREHAIAWKVSQSPKADKIYCAPGNAGIAEIAECVNISAMEFEKLAAFAKEKEIDLTLLIDRCSMEIFADDGKICLTERFVCDFNLPYVAIAGEGRIQNIEISTLKSIWRKKQ